MDALKKLKCRMKTINVKESDFKPLYKNIRRLDTTAAATRISRAPRNRRPPTRASNVEQIENNVDEVVQPVAVCLTPIFEENETVNIVDTQETVNFTTPSIENKGPETTESEITVNSVQDENIDSMNNGDKNDKVEVAKTTDEIKCEKSLDKPSMHRSCHSDLSDVSSCPEIVVIASPDLFACTPVMVGNYTDDDESDDESFHKKTLYISGKENDDTEPSSPEEKTINFNEATIQKMGDVSISKRAQIYRDLVSEVPMTETLSKTSLNDETKTTETSNTRSPEKKLSLKSKSVDIDSKMIATNVQLNSKATSVEENTDDQLNQNTSYPKGLESDEKFCGDTPIIVLDKDVIVEN